MLSKDAPNGDEDDDIDDIDRVETSGDILSVPELDDEQQQLDQVCDYFSIEYKKD